MNRIWVLVANQAEAQIYSTERLGEDLLLVEVLIHKEGSAHPRDLVSDAPGRAYDRMGANRHAMEPDSSVREVERRRFVKEMVGRLEKAHSKGQFDQLVVLAAPAVLGVIRKMLPADIAKTVIKEISKDVIGQGTDKIQSQLAWALEYS